MPVQVGNSYVSEAALSYAQNQVGSQSRNILNDLSKQFKDYKFSADTQPFNGTGTNNISIAPNILRQMTTNPEKRLEYEALIYDCTQTLKQREATDKARGVTASGFIIGSDGGLRMWSISKSDDGKNKRSFLSIDKDRLAGRLPQSKKSTNKKTSATLSINDFIKNLRNDFDIVKSGRANISKKYLQNALTDENTRQKLFENLKTADAALKSHEGEIGFQGMSIEIDDEGNMTMTSSKATVTFNEAKRARQLAAAQSVDDVRQVMELLKTDLEDCENGLLNNMCDETEVEKVKNMIERAQQHLNEVKVNDVQTTDSTFSIDLLI